jgi:hypothetical protein
LLRIGDAAGGQHASQQFGLTNRGQAPPGEVAAHGAGGDAARPGDLADGEPCLLPGQAELAAEVLKAGDPAGIRHFGAR